MAEQIEIDARGMRCPRPVVELAKARRRAQAGDQIVVSADDLAFESDVKAWCNATGCRLASLTREDDGRVVRAVIEVV